MVTVVMVPMVAAMVVPPVPVGRGARGRRLGRLSVSGGGQDGRGAEAHGEGDGRRRQLAQDRSTGAPGVVAAVCLSNVFRFRHCDRSSRDGGVFAPSPRADR
jgi:hypothetical protein